MDIFDYEYGDHILKLYFFKIQNQLSSEKKCLYVIWNKFMFLRERPNMVDVPSFN